MSTLQQQATSSKREMSTLRERVTRRRIALCFLVAVMSCVLFDVMRPPSRQISAKLYVKAVYAYQWLSRPHLDKLVRCRYQPSCSDYSIESVRRFGIIRGLAMTVCRISRCRGNVPMGTSDPVPERSPTE